MATGGVQISTGREFVPGAYERHYTLGGLRTLVERCGWAVRECRLNHEGESHGLPGSYIYLVATPAAASTGK